MFYEYVPGLAWDKQTIKQQVISLTQQTNSFGDGQLGIIGI